MNAQIRVFKSYSYPKNLMNSPSAFYRDSSSSTPFYWMPPARQYKMSSDPRLYYYIPKFEMWHLNPCTNLYQFWCSRLLLYYRRTSVLLLLYYYYPGAVAVIQLDHKILRRVPWNGRNICQDNASLGTCVIIIN